MVTCAGTSGFYSLAGQTIRFDPWVPELQPFLQGSLHCRAYQLPSHFARLKANSPIAQVTGWLADQYQTISLWQDDSGYLLDIPSAGSFWTAADGGTICQVSCSGSTDLTFLAEAFLGPPLILALALRGIWCFHASAIEFEHQMVAFMGESGAGKSTLAVYLAKLPGVRRVSDDILPVMWEDGKLYALPHFPQLKIPQHQQPGLGFPQKLPLMAVYYLDEQPAISIKGLGSGNSALLLAGHTVAARLFDRQLLSNHFSFCGQAAAGISVRGLAYPRQWTELPWVLQALKDDLDSVQASKSV